jgi:transmembrane sensor
MRRQRAHGRWRPRPPAVRWLTLSLAAAAAFVLAVGLSARMRVEPATVAPLATQGAEIVTGEGELATVRLEDGTVARLAPRSRLRLYAAQHERVVSVEGHAFFAVAKNPTRPFRVRTSEGDLVALGTRFDVRSESKRLRLAVLEGRVALYARGERTEVGTGEGAGVQEGVPISIAKLRDLAAVTRWMRRFLAFQSTSLQTVALEIERVYGRRVVINDPSLARETVTATFTDESLEQVMSVVCTVVGVQCVVTESQVTIGR